MRTALRNEVLARGDPWLLELVEFLEASVSARYSDQRRGNSGTVRASRVFRRKYVKISFVSQR